MPIKALFNEGAVDKGKLEAFADACLSVIARPLWYGKSVKIIEKDNKLIAEHDPNSKSFTESINPPGNIGFLLVGIGYLVASVLAFIPLTIGLGLKKIALVNDPKARLYNQMASHCLQKEKVEERLKQVQREKVEVDKTIAAAAKTILTLDNIKEGDETPQITGLKKSCNWTIEKYTSIQQRETKEITELEQSISQIDQEYQKTMQEYMNLSRNMYTSS